MRRNSLALPAAAGSGALNLWLDDALAVVPVRFLFVGVGWSICQVWLSGARFFHLALSQRILAALFACCPSGDSDHNPLDTRAVQGPSRFVTGRAGREDIVHQQHSFGL